jgi:Predicted transcriptional regulators
MRMNLERLRRGALRMLILDALSDRSMHAYEIMKSIEKKFGGVYKPSPGSLYPVLKSLIREGLIEVEMREDKKIYKLTEAGKAKWREAKSNVKSLFSSNTNYRKLISQLFDISLLLYGYREKTSDQILYERLNRVLEECRGNVEAILEDSKQSKEE